MKLYFYCSSGSMLEYFTLNKIVCNKYLEKKNRKIIHSIGLTSDDFLFLTPKKLKHENRIIGFDQDICELPIAVEISIPDQKKSIIPVIVLNSDGSLSEKLETLENSGDILGYFIAGEIPYSYITSICFENNSGKDDIYRPSKDLFFPEHLYGILDDSFNEEIETEKVVSAGIEIGKKYENNQIVETVSMRNKMSSIILNIILETQGWQFGDRHIANFDDLSLDILGLKDNAAEETNGLYKELHDNELKDTVLENWLNGTENSDVLGSFFQALISQLMKRNLNAFAKEEFNEVMNSIFAADIFKEGCPADLVEKIRQIEGLVYGNSGVGLDNLIESFDDGYKVLQGLVFFLRNPFLAMKLADSLSVYKVNSEARRYAWIMFAALNGVERIPSSKTSNEFVMNVSEAYAIDKFQNEFMINQTSENKTYERSFKLIIEEVVLPEEVRELILSEGYADRRRRLIRNFFDNRVLSKGIKESDFELVENPFKNTPKDEYVNLQQAKAIVKQLGDALKTPKIIFDVQAFLASFIQDQKKFIELYNKDKMFWEAIYKDGRDK